MDEENYLIWSNEHRAWWKAGGWGYSTGMATAGRFSRAQAVRICKDALPTAMRVGTISEIMVREKDLYAVLGGQMFPECIVKGRE